MSLVIDTNVAIVANGKHEAASVECVEKCIDALLEARANKILIDDQYLIMNEYKAHLSFAGQPGAGDLFFKWLWSNHVNEAHCRQVPITPELGDDWRVFIEIPNDEELEGFDRDDQKFVAVALASGEAPEVLNASDTDWWNFRVPLERSGVRIRFLCVELMARDRE